MLCELLTGCHPFDLEKKELSKIEKLIRSQTPQRPSDKFGNLSLAQKNQTASKRDMTPTDLTEDLVGDLDAIVLKALRKEPDARYRSVEQMLEDISRYERSRPLIAQSDTIKYRVGKFARRNRKAIIGAFLILAAILGFGSYHIGQISEQREIAETEAEKAQTVKNFLVDIFRSSDPLSADFEGKNITAQQLLVNGKNRVGEELKNQPDKYTEIMLAIGEAQKNIDAYTEAEQSYKNALAKTPETTKPIEYKLQVHVKLGWLYTDWRSSQKIARQYAENAQKLLKKIENSSPALEASVFELLGRVISVRGNYKEGIPYFEKADSIYVNAGLENSYDYIKMLTAYSRSLLTVFDFEKSIETLKKSNKLHRQKYDNPTLTTAENYKFMAWSHRELGNFEKSKNYFLKSIELKRELTGDQTVQTAIPMYHLARNYTLSGDFEKSEQLAREVLNIYKDNFKSDNQFVLQAKRYIAIAKYNQNELTSAKELLRALVKSFAKKDGKDHISFANTGAHLALVYQKMGEFEKAVSLLKECIRINRREVGKQTRAVAVDMVKLAGVYREMDNYKMSEKYFQQAGSILTEETPENHYRRAELYFKYGKLKRNMGDAGEAQQYFKKAYTMYLDNFGAESKRTEKAKSFLEQIAEAQIKNGK